MKYRVLSNLKSGGVKYVKGDEVNLFDGTNLVAEGVLELISEPVIDIPVKKVVEEKPKKVRCKK